MDHNMKQANSTQNMEQFGVMSEHHIMAGSDKSVIGEDPADQGEQVSAV